MDLHAISEELQKYVQTRAKGSYDRIIEYGDVQIRRYGKSIAVAYDFPGGSTNQICLESRGRTYVLLGAEEKDDLEIKDEAHAIGVLKTLIESIPGHRHARLCELVQRWFEEGQTTSTVTTELRALQNCSKHGGKIIARELSAALLEYGRLKHNT